MHIFGLIPAFWIEHNTTHLYCRRKELSTAEDIVNVLQTKSALKQIELIYFGHILGKSCDRLEKENSTHHSRLTHTKQTKDGLDR